MAAGPMYSRSAQNVGQEVVHAAHRMHLVVSSYFSRSLGDCKRSRSGGGSSLMRNGLTALYFAKNPSISTTRSLMIGNPRKGSTTIGLLSFATSRIRILHASRLRPLIIIASLPQMPCAHERRSVNVPSTYHLILCSPSSSRSFGSASTLYSSQCGRLSVSGLNRLILKRYSTFHILHSEKLT